jgi:hypothetical protein
MKEFVSAASHYIHIAFFVAGILVGKAHEFFRPFFVAKS